MADFLYDAILQKFREVVQTAETRTESTEELNMRPDILRATEKKAARKKK